MTAEVIRWATAGIIILIELILLFHLVTQKDSKLQYLIKDVSAQEKIRDASYSYARSQLLWWTLIVITCFVVDFALTSTTTNIMNNTALVLLGISAGTTVAGRVIDNSQSNASNISQHQDEPSEGFWMDILSDQNGVSIHRFQAVLFNIAFGLAFVVQFIGLIPDPIVIGTAVAFPEFDSTTLGLIGLSSGTYATLKFSENLGSQNTTTAGTAAPAPQPTNVAPAPQTTNMGGNPAVSQQTTDMGVNPNPAPTPDPNTAVNTGVNPDPNAGVDPNAGQNPQA